MFKSRLYWLLCLMNIAIFPRLVANSLIGEGHLKRDTLPYLSQFTALCDTLSTYFYNPSFIATEFPTLKKTYSEKVEQVKDPQTFSLVVNDLLKKFHTSHTAYYTPADGAYYHLAGIFNFLPAVKKQFKGAPIQYPSIGLLTERTPQGLKVAGVLHGSQAEAAGFQCGDYLLSQNGAPYQLDHLQDLVGTPVRFTLIRNGELLVRSVVPEMINPQDELEDASRASIRVIRHQEREFGYIRLWSFAGERYYELLKESVLFGELKETEALILDLRGGWGGANPEYLNLFNKAVPVMTFRAKDGQTFSYDSQWRKPVVLLVDKSVRSGKEVLAFGFRKYQIGKVIGTQTAGALTGGRVFIMPGGNLLYLAVNMASIDGEILEGKGVDPDIFITDNPGTPEDEVLDRALQFLTESAKK